MEANEYSWLTRKKELKTKPKSRPLPKATQKYLEAEEEFTQALDNLEIKYEKKFQFKSTKHWRFDFHLIEHRILVEIAGGPWSGGRKGKLATKAWSMDRYDVAESMGYTVVRLEAAPRFERISKTNWDPKTETYVEVKENYSGRGVLFGSYSQYEIQTLGVLATDKKATVLQNEVTMTPKIDDEWLTSLGSFRVIHIQQDPASIIWKCQLRKV
ncbi:hypothetical protein FXF41_17520 [Acinetobacter baumannii]|nr:hypothetical protein FXF41_17520 [Acinetobacter baumannii]